MTQYISIFFLLFSLQSIAQQKHASDSATTKLVIDAIYTGNNFYIHNPFRDAATQRYCTDSVFVNGKRYDINLNVNTYEIKLDSIIQTQGTRIELVIYHSKQCKPILLSSMSFPPPTCKVEFTSFNIDSTGKVHFTTTNGPSGNRPDLIIEQRRGNTWRTVLYVPQKWETTNTYDTSVILTAGNNTFNLRERYPKPRTTELSVVIVKSTIPAITCKIDTVKSYIVFSDSAYYQIENTAQEVLCNGYAKTVDISFLKRGDYILFYENEQLLFSIKRTKNKKRNS